MKKITQKKWDNAVNNVKTVLAIAEAENSWTMMFYISGCKDLLERYDDGERTEELYEEMINAH